MTDRTRERLEAALREGVERMGSVLAEYDDAGENERPFVMACAEWYRTASAALAASVAEPDGTLVEKWRDRLKTFSLSIPNERLAVEMYNEFCAALAGARETEEGRP